MPLSLVETWGVKNAAHATTQGLRLSRSDQLANYAELTVSAGGDLTIAPLGGDTAITGTLAVSGAVTGGTYNGQTISASASLTGTLAVAGVALFASGAVGAPGVSFSADADCGLYRIGANNLGVAVNGAKVLDVGTAGLGVTGAIVNAGAGLNIVNLGAAPGTGAMLNIDVAALTYAIKFYNGSTHVGYIASSLGTACEIGGGASMPLHLSANNLGKWDVEADAAGTSTLSSENATAIIKAGGTDGADNRVLYLSGGGAAADVARGAYIALHGNENGGTGQVHITAGNVSGGTIRAFAGAGAEKLRLDSSSTATHTALLLYDVDNATLERVTVGAADSGGAGFKVLRIPN